MGEWWSDGGGGGGGGGGSGVSCEGMCVVMR